MKLPRLAACLATALVLVIAPTPAVAVTKTDRKQNKSIRTLDKRTKAAARQLGSLNSDAAGLKADLTALQGSTGSLRAAVDSAAAAITQLTSGLAGLEGSLNGLASFAGNGLENTFTGYAAATEYGVAQLYFDPEGDGFEANDATPGQLIVSADVPDDRSQSTVTGRLFVNVPDGTTVKPVALKVGMRSGEKDGTDASNPVGVAGLMAMTASMIGAPRDHIHRWWQPGHQRHPAADLGAERRPGRHAGLPDPGQGASGPGREPAVVPERQHDRADQPGYASNAHRRPGALHRDQHLGCPGGGHLRRHGALSRPQREHD